MSKVVSYTEKPTVYGTGLVALDIVISSNPNTPAYQWAGGTCGNVLAILAYLGWNSFPIARLNSEPSSQCVVNDLKKWKVREDFLRMEPQANVPVITQEILLSKSGVPKHRFHWRNCPKCGSYLPNYKPVTLPAVNEIKSKVKRADLFFFDRISPGALELAKFFKELGAIIFFEPSAKGDPNHFKKAVEIADIVKYSDQRFKSITKARSAENRPFLEIQTLGEKGLRYRKNTSITWTKLPSFQPYELKDSCGCGDWTTAGVIDEICRSSRNDFFKQPAKSIRKGILRGQAMAAWSCGFEGARSGMYQIKKSSFTNEISEIMKLGRQTTKGIGKTSKASHNNASDGLCPSCPH